MAESRTSIKSISVAEAKRHFADVLGAVRYNGQRYIVERNGTPMAALVPLSDLESPTKGSATGFLALIGAFDDAPEFADLLDAVVADRGSQESRPAPRLDV